MKIIFSILSVLLIISCNQQVEKKTDISSEKPLELKKESEADAEGLVTQVTYTLNDIQTTLIQTKSDGKEFYCKSKLLIFKNEKLIDSLIFTPEPVGGYFGISKPNKIEMHLMFTKHGDYDGRTVLVNENGKVFNIIGGENFYDSETNLLFSIYESDLSGFTVFNLKADSTVFEMPEMEDQPISFHKAYGERYFILCTNDETDESDKSIWEIEFDLERIMQVDLDTNQINKTNILATWTLEDVNCECEKQ